jgi:hypothetical protein
MVNPIACGDGSGGLLVAWGDTRYSGSYYPFVTRILSGNVRPAGWSSDGTLLYSGGPYALPVAMVPDRTGGAVVACSDQRNGGVEIYATRLNGSAVRVPGWSSSGSPVATAGALYGVNPAMIPDGSGGAFAAFTLGRGGPYEMLAQNIDGFGALGDVRPQLAKPADVRGDQGGQVRLQWGASWLDQPASLGIGQYWIWRQTPVAAAQAAVQQGLGRWEDGGAAGAAAAAPASGTRLFRPAGAAAASFAWEYVTALGSNGSAQYSYVAATASDSTSGHNPQTVFMVEARGATAGTFWQSAPDSGYSVDNLPPLPPAPFAGTYNAGTSSLHWRANLESDLAGYRLYRGTTAAFVPAAGNLVGAVTDTAYADASGQPWIYKLSAVDSHGNESRFTTLTPSGTLGVGGDAPRELALAPPMPNPLRGQGTVAFTLSRPGRASLALYDAGGRRVRVLAEGEFAAGERRVTVEARDAAGRPLSAGLYWVRLEAEGRSLSQRLLLLR